ncbi:MAG: hypothetical protein AABX32_04980 [Nanoarchaeota archaeon]
MSEKKYLQFIAEFLIMLVVTIPFYTTSVYAGINSVSVKGSSGIENLVKTRDNLNFDVTVSLVQNTTIANRQVVLGSNLSFDRCAAGLDNSTHCTLKFPSSGDFTFSYNTFPYTIHLYKSNGALDESKSGAVLVDRKAPQLQVSVPRALFSGRDNITINYDATDSACDDAQCAGQCSGIKKIDFSATNGSFRQSVDVQANDTSCQLASSIGIPATTFSDGAVTLLAVAVDKFDQSSGNASVSFSVDNTPPTILASSFTIARRGVALTSYSHHNIPVDVLINISASDLNPSSVTADLSSLNPLAGLENARASCTSVTGLIRTCKWQITMNPPNSSAGNSITVTAFDLAGNNATSTFTKALTLDDQGPSVTSIATGIVLDGKNYARASGNTVTAILSDATGVEKESVFLHVGSARIPATSCAKDSSWKCIWENVNFVSSINVSITSDTTDILLNPVTSPKSESVIVDITAPVLTNINVTPQGSLSDFNVDIFKIEDKIAVVANITETNPLAATADFSSFITGASKVAGSCTVPDASQPSKKQCTWLTDPVDISADNSIKFNFSDPVNNELIYPFPLKTLELDTTNPPNFWRSTVSCSPRSVDRQLGTFINQRVYCQVVMVPNMTSPTIIPLAVSSAACVSKSALVDSYGTISTGSASTTPLIKITLKKDELKVDEINVTCGFNIVSKVGERVTKNPEIEITNVTIRLYNLPLGEMSDEVQKKIDDAKDDAKGISKVIGSLNTIIGYAKKICQMFGVIYTTVSIYYIITAKTKAVAETCFYSGLGTITCYPVMQAVSTASCLGQQGSEGAADKGWVTTGGPFCKFVNCQWAPGVLGKWQKFMTEKVDSLPGAKYLPGASSKGKPGQESMPGDGLKGGLSSYMDMNNNLIVAAAFGCIPGIITGLDKFRQVRCLYADCLINAVGKDGLPLQACEDQKSYAYCKYVTGELFAILPYTAVFDYMTGIVKNALSNPFAAAGIAVGAVCYFTCPQPPPGASAGYILCAGFRVLSKAGEVFQNVKGLVNEGFKAPQDYCSRLDLGDETNSTAAA